MPDPWVPPENGLKQRWAHEGLRVHVTGAKLNEGGVLHARADINERPVAVSTLALDGDTAAETTRVDRRVNLRAVCYVMTELLDLMSAFQLHVLYGRSQGGAKGSIVELEVGVARLTRH
jgi:hypothetical protein